MTDHNIISAEQWPEWADRHCWDENKEGHFYGTEPDTGIWMECTKRSNIPMPEGWDWRVPVMRKQSQAIDLKQYAVAVQYAINGMREAGGITNTKVAGKLESLLALIDVQAKRTHAPDAWTDDQCAEFLSVAMRHVQIKGVLTMNEVRQGQMRANAMQPTKGEEE